MNGMLYLNSNDIDAIGVDWNAIIDVMGVSAHALSAGDFSQPIKPYLRYKNLKNRIIAMPAYLGGAFSYAGIKWIASFPENIKKGIPRAHSVTILNAADSGIPVCIINTTKVSGIRTAGVSGLVLRAYLKRKPAAGKLNAGIIGFGPIGKMHLDMVTSILGDRLGTVYLYDIAGIDKSHIPASVSDKVVVCNSWQDCYRDADVFVTCTVSNTRYIDEKPKAGSLQLNVSLRDYSQHYNRWVDKILVDDWEEVCRENTDIEAMFLHSNLKKEDTYRLVDILGDGKLGEEASGDVWMFNPMGMAIFDIGVGAYYYQTAKDTGVGLELHH